MSEQAYDFRDSVFSVLHRIALEDSNVVILTNDMGAMGLDRIREELPSQVFNVGISEQNMMSMAGGLALVGKSVFVYGIVAHITARCFEQIKLDICFPNLPVTILGVGAGLSYGVDGPTHHGVEDIAILSSLGNMQIFNPADGPSAGAALMTAYKTRQPAYIRLDKEVLPALYSQSDIVFSEGLAITTAGKDAAILSTGVLSWAARDAAKMLLLKGFGILTIDVFRIKPINNQKLVSLLADIPVILVAEENVAFGGLGTVIAEIIAQNGFRVRFCKLSLGNNFLSGSSSREWASKKFGLDSNGLSSTLESLLTGGGSK
jgi:transketolase